MLETDVFLTHDWGTDEKGRNNHHRVQVINEALKKRGYRTWFDADKLQGDIVSKMADGIDNAKAVLVFITQKYQEKVNGDEPNDNCRLEFQYALNTKTSKGVVCVLMETRMADTKKWGRRLGFYCGNKMYIDMAGDLDDVAYLEGQLHLLYREMEAHGVPKPDPNVIRDSTTTERAGTDKSAVARAAVKLWKETASDAPEVAPTLTVKDNDAKTDATNSIAKEYRTYPNLKEDGLGKDGIIYALGTHFGTKDYENPGVERRFLTVSRSDYGTGSNCLGEVTAFTGREAVHSHTREALNSFYMIELKEQLAVCPTAYKLRSYVLGGGHFLINWEFDASNDGTNWTVLRNHSDDQTIANFGLVGCWDVECDKYFKYFRVLLTGKTALDTQYLCVSGFELYGSLETEGKCEVGGGSIVFDNLNQSELGTDGILYAFGTHFNSQEYKNPGIEKYFLSVSRSTHGTGASCTGEVTAFTGREAVHSHTLPALNSFYMIEIKRDYSVRPTAYKLMSYGSGGRHMPLNWNFEASNDNKSWTVLRSHKDDKTIAEFGAVGCWDVISDDYFTYFRILLTGNTSKGTEYLCVSGFELYGSLKKE